jgi:hypothetical protein
MSLQHARSRKAVSDAAKAYRTDPIEISKRQEQSEKNAINHYWNSILTWANETNPKSGQADRTDLCLPINKTIPEGVLDAWESELFASGYYVERDEHLFKIST